MPRGITSNAAALARRMLARKAAVVRELSSAARAGAVLAGAESRKVLQTEVYNVPIPLSAAAAKRLPAGSKIRQRTTKGKHGAWQRTGSLKRQESARAEGPVIILANNAAYAAARHDLGTA